MLFSSVYALVKQIDERRQILSSNDQLFDADIKTLRHQLITKIDDLIFQPHISIGRKSREILWRKGFYDVISMMKRNWSSKSVQIPAADLTAQRDEMMLLIHEGIAIYRSIVVRFDRYFDMDLRNIVDFSAFVDGDDDAVDEITDSGQLFPLDMLNYGVETVHGAMLSLGDLHRYFIDFNFDKPKPMDREMAARFYNDAFQLNTKIGMAQNQLGTLFSGKRFDLDAMYHYLHALVCPIPFGLSENNVAKIFAANADYLKMMVEDGVGTNVRDFMARFKLIADIFFYDKEVTDFHMLCHCLLIDLRFLLANKRSQLGDDFLFKVVGILMFCLTKLSANRSSAVHSLNALLVAICSEMVDSAIGNLEKFIESRVDQNAKFQETYGTLFELFDRKVRLSRKADQSRIQEENGKNTEPINGKNSMSNNKTVPSVTKRNSFTSESSVGSSRNFSGEMAKDEGNSKNIEKSEDARKKPVFKLRRRRRRLTSEDSDDQANSNGGSYGSEDYQLDSEFSSNEDLSESDSSDEEVVDEKDIQQLDVTLQPGKQYSDSEDLIVEEERLIYKNGMSHNAEELIEGSLDRMLMQICHISNEDAKLNLELIGNHIPENKNQYQIQNDFSIIPESNDKPMTTQKLQYQLKYKKVDPNIIIEFAQNECTLPALKLLFDWLRINIELLINCFASNPEFVHKILRFMNHINVDIFTYKVCFDRSSLLKCVGIQHDLVDLFNARATIPLSEDLMVKDLAVLATGQQLLDFESRMQLNLTANEESILRLFKLVDFGFLLSKTKQFGYNFCTKSRVFVISGGSKENGKRQKANGVGRNNLSGEQHSTRNRRTKRRKNENRVRKRMVLAKPLADSYTTSADENDVTLLASQETSKVCFKYIFCNILCHLI